MTTADIGLVGLGVMGSALALNIADKGHRVAVYNRTPARTADFMASAGNLAARLTPCSSLQELARALDPPRPILLMIKAGAAIDEQAALLEPTLGRGDILIDAGNADFHDTERRCAAWAAKGIGFLGVGVSGGEDGARHGPSIMAGGPGERLAARSPDLHRHRRALPWRGVQRPGRTRRRRPLRQDDPQRHRIRRHADDRRSLCGHARRPRLGAGPSGRSFAAWNDGPLRSYLIEITASVLRARDARSGDFLIDHILDKAGQKGTGRWAVIEAQNAGYPGDRDRRPP